MEHLHPLGDDFARWVELTDDYVARIAHATAQEMPDRGDLGRLAAGLREAERRAQFRHRSELRSRRGTACRA